MIERKTKKLEKEKQKKRKTFNNFLRYSHAFYQV